MKTEKLLYYLAIGVGIYVVYRMVTAASQTPAKIGVAASNAIFDFLHPPSNVGVTFHTVLFPDGTSHAVDASTVASDGNFVYNGVDYILSLVSPGNQYVALPAASMVSAPQDMPAGSFGRIGRYR